MTISELQCIIISSLWNMRYPRLTVALARDKLAYIMIFSAKSRWQVTVLINEEN